jgi:hypothetical protein
MKLAMILAAGAAALAANSAMAQTACTKPAEPMPVDGKTATMEQLVAAKNGVTGFITASDAWQTCVLNDVKAKKDAAKAANMPFDANVEKAANADVAENQAAKERTGKWFNDAVKAYRSAHPS